ncbi:MAG: Xaa-Pro peptidase family protein [Planctomycetota bacterium]
MTTRKPQTELKARLERFRRILIARKLNVALIVNEQNVRYLSGFTGSDSALLITSRRKYLLTDFRYIEEGRNSARGWTVVTRPSGNLMKKSGYYARKLRVRKLAVEATDMRLADLRALRKAAPGVKIKPEDSLVGELRIIKSPWEVRQIEAALRIQEACFKKLCRSLKPGISEREAAAKLRYLMVQAGGDDQAFESMFQIGSHSSLPHGRPTQRHLPRRAIILIDWGAKVAGYHSDLTRTFFLGNISSRFRNIYGIVLAAQQAAIQRIAPGVALADVDKAARQIISKAGYGKAFGHSTGHGVGLNIHESPSLSARAKGVLKAGMVVTVEPGIYLPGIGGVRIEDMVLVTSFGHRVLSRLEKGLRWSGET